MRGFLRRFFNDPKGNVAILFAIAVVPIIGAMGAAIDYSMANAQRTAMQAAIDATALALVKIMPASQQELNARGAEWFAANLGTTPITNIQLTITPSTGKLNLEAVGIYKPEIVNVLGVQEFPIGAKTEAKWGFGKIEVALALDNTGSMAGNKLTQLKLAAHNLLNTLEMAAKNPGDAKVSIVPFGKQVKIDTSFREENWLKWDSQAEKTAWLGCVEDRNKNNDVTDVAPTTNARRFPGVFNPGNDCGALTTIQPLTYDWAVLHSKVDQMIATGSTNVPIGLAWGWHTLSSGLPFPEGAAYGTLNLSKFLIILTDGDNTDNRWDDPTSIINQRTALVCTNIKAVGIQIYSIRVINGNASLLQSCASNPSMYFDVQDAGQLNAVFSAIGAQIANLHLSK